jgi:superoxide reductase
MKRREFLKGAVLSTVLVTTGQALATKDYSSTGEKGLLRLKNRENPTDLEKKHVPAIEVPVRLIKNEWFEVKIRVGYETVHPSMPNHWINEITLLVDGVEVARTDFKVGAVSAPEVSFKIRLNKTSTIEAIENCNLHGRWISDPVTVAII